MIHASHEDNGVRILCGLDGFCKELLIFLVDLRLFLFHLSQTRLFALPVPLVFSILIHSDSLSHCQPFLLVYAGGLPVFLGLYLLRHIIPFHIFDFGITAQIHLKSRQRANLIQSLDLRTAAAV